LSTNALANGNSDTADVVPSDPLDEHIAALESMLPALAAERGQIEAQLRDVSEREQRIHDGVAGLRGKRPAKPAAAQTAAKKATSKANPPSQKALDDVYAVVARASEPISVQEIADSDGIAIGRSAVQNTIMALRAQERVRVAAKRGVTKLYSVMP
jgi:ribosomal protein S11